MGDLKKKKDFIIKSNNEYMIIESMPTEAEKNTVKRLQSYIQKFYEMQIEKQAQEEEEIDG